MDVEQLRKINEMSKTLQKHGLANTSEEGSRIAGSMMEEDVPGREGPKEPVAQAQNSDGAELLIERHSRKIQKQLEQLHEKITQLETRVALQEQQLCTQGPAERVAITDTPQEVASQIQNVEAPVMQQEQLAQQQQQVPAQQQPAAQPLQQAAPIQAQPAQAQQQAQPQSTRGAGAAPQLKSDPDNFDLEEITVEKMFYYGNK